ncbi:GH92 family glycosyl hydrolase [bacterium]|nr:GH92 family glycosyl hydrolase [bacterium]
MRKQIIMIVLSFAFTGATAQNRLCQWVSPFIGTAGHGHTFPGATMPFGMVQLSPDTRLEGWDGCSGYHYSDSYIYGFSHTHLSGTGCSDYGDILLMPRKGKLTFYNGSDTTHDKGYRSPFLHRKETASPGYYAVHLDDTGIIAELTATHRTGLHRYTFPASSESHILIDLAHRDLVLESSLEIVSSTEVEGFRRSRAWAQDQHIYFVAQFSKSFVSWKIKNDDVISSIRSAKGNELAVSLHFNTAQGEMILVKVGISAVSIEGARRNLEAEQDGFDFNSVKAAAESAWEAALGKIIVEGGRDSDKTVFYTSLYHSLIAPNLYQDVDGCYRGRDMQIHESQEFNYYTVFSLWDTFRAAHPLFTIIDQKRTVDFIKTMLAQYVQGGRLPVWELAANETDCMIGYHSVPVIADAWVKGIRGFDADLALEAMRASAEADRDGIKEYCTYGYIPGDLEPESVSKTLEYSYDDWCIAQLAASLNEDETCKEYLYRAQFYKNIYNPETGFMQAKLNGMWQTPFDPAEVNFHFTEANSWQYSFFVPHDISGMIDLMGGKAALSSKLDVLFTASTETSGRKQADITGLIGQYAHGNEPSHHMAYLYNYADQPWKTQKRVSEILNLLYSDQSDGLCGNEDCGQMSAWYVLSAMGFYSITPGDDIYAIGSPLFNKVTINLENGNCFVIEADNPGVDNPYIKSATLNGYTFDQTYLKHETIMNGGHLKFSMDNTPDKKWGLQARPTAITQNLLVASPVVKGATTFYDTQEISITTAGSNEIFYTVDGSRPTCRSTSYVDPVFIDKSTVLSAISMDDRENYSHVMKAEFHKIPMHRSISYTTPYSPQYTAGGTRALIDFIRGGNDFRTGKWQGFRSGDVEATVDLGEVQEISQISVGFLQNVYSWIWMPESVEFMASVDGKKFNTIKTVIIDTDETEYGAIIKEVELSVDSLPLRFLRIKATGRGPIPRWHPGKGSKRWIFIDEIMVK